MRALILAVSLTLSVAPVGAKEPYWDGDHFLECLLGKGGVAMRHGAQPNAALEVARKACVKTMEPEGSAADNDGDYVDYVIGIAQDTLQAAADRGNIF